MTEPFRKCDYCGCKSRKVRVSNKPGANAWTLWGHSRKLSCPKCRDEGRAEDDKVNLLLLQFGDLLRHRLLAEPMALYGDEHDHRSPLGPVSDLLLEPMDPEGIDLWDLPDMTAEEACVVQEPPAAYGTYLFQQRLF